MPKVVQVGDQQISFPDDATEAQMTEVLARDFAPASKDPPSVNVAVPGVPGAFGSYDDNLARAARDFEGLRSIGLAGYNQPGPPSIAARIGRGFQLAGQAVKASVADVGDLAFSEAIANVRPDLAQPDKGEPPSNIQAFASDQPLPAETQLKVLPKALEVTGRAAEGLVGSAPQMAAIAGSELAGVPPWVSGPIVFGSTPEGFDPQQAAIAGALPFVGRYGGEIAGALARKLGVSSSQAENIWKGVGGATAAAGYLATIDASRIANLPEKDKHAAMVDAVANSISQLALGPMGARFREPGAGEIAGALLSRQVQQAAPVTTEPQAIEGGTPIIEPGQRSGGPPIVTPSDLPPPKPPIEPRPAIARAPGNLFRPEVPEGPAPEERLTVLEEIRRAGARTTREVQDLFPDAKLTREQAATFRRQAWEEPNAGTPQGETLERPAPDEAVEPAPQAEPAAPVPAQPEPRGVERFAVQYEPGKGNAFSTQVGLELSKVSDLDELLEARRNALRIADRWRARAEKMKDDPTARDEALQAWVNENQRAQLAREAIEVATNSGSWAEGEGQGVSLVELGKRPLDWQSSAQARTWLKDNGQASGITLPEELQPAPPPSGAEFTGSTPVAGAKVKGNYDVVDALQLTTSQDLGFDPALQPRDRSRVASQQQIAGIIRNFEPQRLGQSATSDLGAPMVDEEGQVLSGNGRTMAIRQKYLNDQAGDYRDWLLANAPEFGLDPAAIEQMQRPVLVRRVSDYGQLDKAEFARQSNQQQVAGLSEAEKAAADARMLVSARGLVDLFRPGDDGNVLAASNREFLSKFIQGTGDQNELLSKEGYNGPVLTKRVRNAVLGAFIGPENRQLLNQLLEEADTLNVKSSVNALLSAAPQLMKFKGTPYDLSQVTAQALRDLVSLRTPGEKLDDFLENKTLFTDPTRTADSDLLLTFLHQARSAKALADGLRRYAAGAAEALQDVQSGSILGLQPASRQELIARAYANKQPQDQQTDLPTGQPEPAPGPGGQEPLAVGQAAAQAPRRGAQAGARPELLETTPTQSALGPGGRPPGPPPSGQGPSAKASYKPSQAPSLALEEAYLLNPPEMAERAANRDLRGSEQGRDPDLQGASQALTRASALAPGGSRWFSGLRKIFAAGTVDQDAEVMAGIVRHALGQEYENQRQADFALRTWRKEFDKSPVGRNWVFAHGQPLPRNYEVMRAIDTGELEGLTPMEREFAGTMRRLFDNAIDKVQSVSPDSLRNLVENYFPRIWEDPAKNQDKLNQLLSNRPWEGPKSFLKKRVLEYFTDGLALGLKPVSDNPVDVAVHKLGEMYRFTATRQAIEEAKARGLRRFVYIYEKPPGPNWRQVDDPSSTVYKPPTVTVKEAFDAQVRAKSLELLESLGVPHERLVNIGGRRWGYAEPGTGKIVSKFGGPDFVLWHEFGHQMDFRYPDLREMLPTRGASTLANELRALADLRFEGQPVTESYRQYVRQAEEKYANLFDAYIRAPARFQEVAPNAWRKFGEWLDKHPEVKNPLNEIRPSLTMGTASNEMFLGGPVLLGRWMMPEGAAQVVDNYLKPGLGRYQWFRSLREISGLVNGIQLAGFFHGGFVLNDSFYSGIGLSLYDVMQGKFGRAAKELLQVPVSPITSIYRGGKIQRAIENPAAANAQYRQLAKLAVEQNLRAGHGNFDPEFARRWQRSFNEVLTAPSIGAAWETLWRTPMAALQTAMKPVMDILVPRMKLGIYARMAERVITDNPNAGELELRRLLAKAADATEDRLGQVTYDNLFQMRAAKDTMQLAMRAYGWQLTKYRLIFGGAADWARAGRDLAAGQAPEVTFRMTYLPAMVMGHAILGATLHYALTGKRPDKLIDYLFPESGLIDAYGQPVRLAIADFVKDVVADFRSFPHLGKMTSEFTRKLAPFWNMAAEMYRNQDFWGTEIFSRPLVGEPELDHVRKNIWEGIQYIGKSVLPFSVRGANRLEQAGASTLGTLGPMVGVVPAPLYATQSPAQARSQEIARNNLPKEPQTKPAAQRGKAEAQIVREIRTGKINNEGEFEAAAKSAGINFRDKRELTKLRERLLWTPMQYQVHKMSVDQAMEVFDLANDAERVSLAPFLAEKINAAFNSGRLDKDTTHRYVNLVMPYYQRRRQSPVAPATAGGPQPQRRSYSAFSPANP